MDLHWLGCHPLLALERSQAGDDDDIVLTSTENSLSGLSSQCNLETYEGQWIFFGRCLCYFCLSLPYGDKSTLFSLEMFQV